MLNFLPDSLDPTIKTMIYTLIIIHLIIFAVWISLVIKSSKRKNENFE